MAGALSLLVCPLVLRLYPRSTLAPQSTARRPTIQELPFGSTWVQDEAMARASHALVADGRVWIVDPVDSPGVVERAQGLGEVAAVVQLLDRHNRDARRSHRGSASASKGARRRPGQPVEVVRVGHWPKWAVNALWWQARRALSSRRRSAPALFTLGRAPSACTRCSPDAARKPLGGFAPDHLLVGHGPAVDGDASRDGCAARWIGARRDLPGCRGLPEGAPRSS